MGVDNLREYISECRTLSFRQPKLSQDILATLEPTIFTDEAVEQVSEEQLMYIVCRLLGARKDTLLPTATHPVESTVPALIAALSQHYQTNGVLPENMRSLEELLKGYFEAIDSEKKIVCLVDTKDVNTEIQFEYADEVEIVNVMDIGTAVLVKTKGRTTTIDSVAQEFGDEGVWFPPLVVAWKGALFGVRNPDKTPEKRPRTAEKIEATGSACSVFATKSSMLVGEALRRKVNQHCNKGSPARKKIKRQPSST